MGTPESGRTAAQHMLYSDEEVDIESLLEQTRDKINKSNIKEFTSKQGECARTSSIFNEKTIATENNNILANTRLNNIANHCNILLPQSMDIYSRLKHIEEWIMAVEADHAAFAAFHFNQLGVHDRAPLRSTRVTVDGRVESSFEMIADEPKRIKDLQSKIHDLQAKLSKKL